ncbi:hypothetical protein BV25DRAFT_914152 [Artomyces pyxidatus]|uniref:Uncharacterized protein n=1 Tax=Artomyces pyxidatus TaxID=48021 RepID=A0ACB8SYI0_9AGAM|nr:hypothetical protein BV25DRAFT_914152 [Artomyces pyxidatus]
MVRGVRASGLIQAAAVRPFCVRSGAQNQDGRDWHGRKDGCMMDVNLSPRKPFHAYMIRTRSFTSEYDRNMLVPPPTSVISPTFQMPRVFVHPPEDDELDTPPWCLFDAEEDAAIAKLAAFTTPEMAVLESKLGDWQETVDVWENPVHQTADDAPLFHRTSESDADVVMPRRSSFHHVRPDTQSVASAMVGLGLEIDPAKQPKEDEDVVEVVKVPRSHARQGGGEPEPLHGMKKSKTFRARASQAFRSIKNVGKTTRKPPVQDVFPAKENAGVRAETMREARREVWDVQDAPVQRPTTPTLPRRVTRPLSQIFGIGQGSSAPTLSEVEPAPARSASPAPQSQSASTLSSSSSSRRLSILSTLSSHTLRPSSEDTPRPASPSPSLQRSSSSRRRFSFVNLQGIFSSNPAPASLPSPADTNESLPSTAGPQTPVDDDDYGFVISSPHSLDIDMEERMGSQKSSSSNLDMQSAAPPERDISFEMRLDSLHFDSLSFDADQFS